MEAISSDRFGLGLDREQLAELFRDPTRQVDVDEFRDTGQKTRRVRMDSGRELIFRFVVLRPSDESGHVLVLNYRPAGEER